MPKDEQAVRPSGLITDFINKVEEQQVEDITEEEKILGQGASTGFWKVLKRHIDTSIGELDQLNDQAVAQGLPPAEIGQNTIIISLTKGVLKKIVDKVEDAREAAENGRAK